MDTCVTFEQVSSPADCQMHSGTEATVRGLACAWVELGLYTAEDAAVAHLLGLQGVLHCRSGEVFAWGINDFGQLGNGSTFYATAPAMVEGLATTPVADIAAGGWHSLAITTEGGAAPGSRLSQM